MGAQPRILFHPVKGRQCGLPFPCDSWEVACRSSKPEEEKDGWTTSATDRGNLKASHFSLGSKPLDCG